MNTRVSLLFPWVCALVVGALLATNGEIWDGLGAANAAPVSAVAGAPPPCHGGTLSGLPPAVYYSSIGIVLLLSFGLIEWRSSRPRLQRDRAHARFDVLSVPLLRRILKHPATRPAAQGSVVAVFLLIIAAGLFGTQLPTKNVAPLLTWTIWWCGLVLLVLFAGKAWCYVCPWDAVAGWAERFGFRSGRRREGDAGLTLGLRWPKLLRNIWPATILFLGLTWVELGFGVTSSPRATAWLALAILGLAFASAFVFERRSFCRYGCLVGRISGLYALFSPVEIRARDTGVCRQCTTRSCYNGNEHGDPCPTFQYLGRMDQNTYCISCMECVKTCEADNVAFNLRPWATDLLRLRRPRSDEAYLALLMLSLTGFHGLTMTGAWSRMMAQLRSATGISESVAFSIGMVAVIVGPILLYAALVELSRLSARAPSGRYRDHFMRYAYALLPIALFYHLAHNSEHLLLEGQRVLALLSDPFGYEWDLFGTSHWAGSPVISMQTLWAVQVLLVLVGHVYSLWAARQAAGALFSDRQAAFRSQVPMLAAMVLFSVMSLWLLKQPMVMRTSWM